MRKKLLVAITTFVLTLAVAAIAPARVAELGTTVDQQTAACPQDCQAIGQVSGFQIQVGTRKLPYRLRSFGKVVAFTIKLGNETVLFDAGTGGQFRTPVGDKYILEGMQVSGAQGGMAQSESGNSFKDPVTGRNTGTSFSLLALQRFQAHPDCPPGPHGNHRHVRQNAAQTVHGSDRTYGCVYKTARLLYTVTYIPDPKPTSQAPKKKPTTTTPTGAAAVTARAPMSNVEQTFPVFRTAESGPESALILTPQLIVQFRGTRIREPGLRAAARPGIGIGRARPGQVDRHRT